MPNETEIKLPIPSIPALRRRLTTLHAKKLISRTDEKNTLYDTPTQTLRHQGKLIRIRIEHTAQKRRPSQIVLTFKGPTSTTKKNRTPRYKIREELEIVLPSAAPIEHLFAALGLRPAFRYEKFRTTFALPGLPTLKIELDETPVGNFLELEGPPSAIDRAAALLGYTRADYSTQTYADIHLETLRRKGKKLSDMLF